jgi:hypothetical protein
MKKRSITQRTRETAKLKSNPKRQAKRVALVGKKRVAQQNREAYLAPTDKAATRATISRVGEYMRASGEADAHSVAGRKGYKKRK